MSVLKATTLSYRVRRASPWGTTFSNVREKEKKKKTLKGWDPRRCSSLSLYSVSTTGITGENRKGLWKVKSTMHNTVRL